MGFRTLSAAFRALGELFFPRMCLVCGNSLVEGEQFICTACLADFPFSDDRYSLGKQRLDSFSESVRPEEFHSLFYYNKYSDYRRLIYAVKYDSRKKVGVYLGRMLGMRMRDRITVDCIVPIPLHPRRERERGFNQARQVALGISEILGVMVLDDVIVRVVDNASQTGKNTDERRANVENIFKLRNPRKIQGRHVLVVDDVITTGATVGSCFYTLKTAGNVRISFACLAQTEL